MTIYQYLDRLTPIFGTGLIGIECPEAGHLIGAQNAR
jgi:hypothetical protein